MTIRYNFLKPIEEYFVDEPPLLRTAKTIQILVIRQTHDYTIFRTEETRELNIATIPKSINDGTPTVSVVMYASKQKAPENRMYITLFRSYAEKVGYKLPDYVKKCRLKDELCRSCPRCVLFGAVSTKKGSRSTERWNIKHRIEYSSAYSIEPYEQVSELITFNAVDTATQSTGQALGYTENIRPIVNFPSIITLNSVTKEEFILYLKTLLATKSYGAETRVKGDMVNYIVGIVAGFEEIITPLEFVLELREIDDWKDNPIGKTVEILNKYREYASTPELVKVLEKEEVESLIKEIKKFTPNKEFVEKLQSDAENFKKKAERIAKQLSQG